MVVLLNLTDKNNEVHCVNQVTLEDDPESVRRQLKLTVDEFKRRFPGTLEKAALKLAGRPQHELLD